MSAANRYAFSSFLRAFHEGCGLFSFRNSGKKA